MARPRKVSNEAILEATRRLTAVHGLAVSTREIATEAGISEAILYQRFASKGKLLEAALGLPSLEWEAVIARGAGQQEGLRALEGVVLAILDKFRSVIPGILPVLGDPTIALRSALWADDGPLLSCVRDLESHLARATELGRMSAGNPHVTAFVIVSALHGAALFEALHGEVRASDARIRSMVSDLWSGLAPRPSGEPAIRLRQSKTAANGGRSRRRSSARTETKGKETLR